MRDVDINKDYFKVLDSLFRTGVRKTKKELQAALKETLGRDVSSTTLDRALSYFKQNTPLEDTLRPVASDNKSKNLHQYTYKKISFTLYNSLLSFEEECYLDQALTALEKFQFTGQFTWLSPVLELIRNKFSDVGKIPGAKGYYVSVDGNDQYSGTAHLGLLYQCICTQEVLSIAYKSFMFGSRRLVLHPYFLKQYNNRWFLFAWNNEVNKLSVLALDRIKKIDILEDPMVPYRPNRNINFESYFDDIIGVTKLANEPVQKIVLRFSPQRYKYIETKPIHPSQTNVEGCDYTISIKVRWNRELDSTIMYFGNQVEVLEPQSLRDHIKAKVAKMAKKYNIIKS